MPSAIDPTKPVAGNPTTESVRDNFAAAKSEIEVLQLTAGVGPQGPIGPIGPAGTITVNPTVITGNPGTNANVTVGGTPQAATLQFTVPRGDTGAGGGGITETQAIEAVQRAQPVFSEQNVTTVTIPTATADNLAGIPTMGANWTGTATPTATTAYTHAEGSTEPLSYPVSFLPGETYQIVIGTVSKTSDLPPTAFFTPWLRTGPTVTAGQQAVVMLVGGSPQGLAASTTINIVASAAFSHFVVVPASNWSGNFTLTRIVRITGRNSQTLTVKGYSAIVRGSSLVVGGGGGLITSDTANITGFGQGALSWVSGGGSSNNTALGFEALKDNTTGSNNVALGHQTLINNRSGNYNVAIGAGGQTMRVNITGGYNIALGYYSLDANIHGSYNVALGPYALMNNTNGSDNTAVGHQAMGYGPPYSAHNLKLNTACGAYSMTWLESGAEHNAALGAYALYRLGTATDNVAIGYEAARFYGDGSQEVKTAERSIFIGAHCRAHGLAQNNQIVIGADAHGHGSNTITLGNDEITHIYANISTISVISDSRVKENIQPASLDACLNAVKNLRVSRWKWQPIAGAHLNPEETGFLAEDVEKVFPHAVTKSDEYLTVRDAQGKAEMTTVSQVIPEFDGVSAHAETLQIEKTIKFDGLQRIALNEALPTLWGAVQKLIQEVEALKKK